MLCCHLLLVLNHMVDRHKLPCQEGIALLSVQLPEVVFLSKSFSLLFLLCKKASTLDVKMHS